MWRPTGAIGRKLAAVLGSSVCGGGLAAWMMAGNTQASASPAQGDRLRVLFIRHGESYNNTLCKKGWGHYKKYRQPDPSLSDKGQKQVEAAAEYLATAPPVVTPLHRIYASPMTRALMTARPMATKLNIRPMVWADLYEVGGCFGGQEGSYYGEGGLTRSQMEAKFPDYHLPEDVTARGWYPRNLMKESNEHAQQRAKTIALRLKDLAMSVEGEENIAVVAHYDTIDLVLRELLDIPHTVKTHPPGAFFKHYNVAFTCVDIAASGKRTSLLFQNSASHLPKELVEWDKLGIV